MANIRGGHHTVYSPPSAGLPGGGGAGQSQRSRNQDNDDDGDAWCCPEYLHAPYLEVHGNRNNHRSSSSSSNNPDSCPGAANDDVDGRATRRSSSSPVMMKWRPQAALGKWEPVSSRSVIPVFIFTILIASQFAVILAINAAADGESHSNGMDNSLGTRSMFTTKNNTSIIAQRGGVAVLPCGVRINSQATVSWIRRRDYKLLTVGQATYSSDERFTSEFGRHLGHWSLRIKGVRVDDSGVYECQLSSYPPQSIFVELKISEVMTEIGDGGTDIHIDEGSQLRLECKLRYATEIPTFAFWYFGDRMINYELDDGYVVEDISRFYNGSNSLHYKKHLVISILIVESVNKKHAGNYSCSPSNAKSAQVTVHVLHDEKPAAMQHANRGGNNVKLNFTLASIIIFLSVICVLDKTTTTSVLVAALS